MKLENRVEFPETMAASYVCHINDQPLNTAIHNADTRLLLLSHENVSFPVTVTDHYRRDNTYVVSPLSAYIDYATAELPPLPAWMTATIKTVLRGMGRYLDRRQLDRHIAINNWLLSTNLYPQGWAGENLAELTQSLAEAMPEHAIVWRSLNSFSNADLLQQAKAAGYLLVPSRRVFILDARAGKDSPFLRRKSLINDARKRRNSPYQLVLHEELLPSDFPRIEALYRALYIDKYNALNPQYSAHWLQLAHQYGWLQFCGLRHVDGTLDGVIGWFSNETLLSTPVIGYNTERPQSDALYRQLSWMTINEAVRRRCVLNFSAGAADYKQQRGGVPVIEYSAVYVKHLSKSRQRAWSLIAAVTQRFAVPLMHRFNL